MDWSSVDQARGQAQQAAASANAFSAKGNVLADELRKAIGERFGQSGIAQDTAKARTDFMAAAPQARADVLGMVQGGSILSPTQQNAILAAKRGSALMPLMGANLVQDAAFGTMEDLINAGTNAFKAKTQEQQGLASIAQGNYSSLLNELLQRAEEERAAQSMSWKAEEQDWKRQMQPIEMQTAIARLNDIGSGGGGSSPSLQPVEVGGQLYNYNPKTGEYTKANISGGKSKYSEQDVVDFANAVSEGRAKLTGVPAEIRGQVDAVVTQLNAAKPNWLQSAWNAVSGLFNQ